MPVSRIRGDYEQLAQIAQTFGTQADQLNAMLQRLKAEKGNLVGGDWIGVGARKFYDEMDTQVQPALQRLVNALQQARQVTREISAIIKQAETDAAACFRLTGTGAAAPTATPGATSGAAPTPSPAAGTATGTSTGTSTPPGAPKTMGELYKMIEDLPKDQPVKIIQTGPKDYMILVRGTDPTAPQVALNMGGALDGGMTGHSDYMRQIKDYIANAKPPIPPGANLTLAGHSQGGIAVNDLADDQSLRGKYNIQNVITFGAPEAAYKQPGTNYFPIKNPLDVVTYADRTVLEPKLGIKNDAQPQFGVGLDPVKVLKTALGVPTGLGEMAVTTATQGFDNIAHLNYESYAAKTPFPPEVQFTQWQEVSSSHTWTPPKHGLASVLSSGNDLVFEGGKNVIAMGVNTVVIDPVINVLPPNLRNAIDGYRDRLTDAFLQIPSPTQVISSFWPFKK